LKKVHKSARFIGLGILFFAFVAGGFSMAQQALPTGPSSGADDSTVVTPTWRDFPAGATDIWAFFSTRTPVTLYGKDGYFYAKDQDVVRTSSLFFGEHLKLFLKGITEFGLYSMDALDVVFDKGCNNEGSYETEIIFSVREDQLLWDGEGNPYYVKKNDVAEYNVDTGEIEVLFKGDLYLAPRIDGVSFTEFLGKETLYISTAEDWFFNSPSGMFYVHDEDIVKIPMNGFAEPSPKYEVVFRGKDIGLTTLDAFDFHLAWLYISVRDPILVQYAEQWPPFPVYAEDGDMVVLDWLTYNIWWIYKGEKNFIYTVDGLSVAFKPHLPE
jgi:hypothetical protein